MKKKALSLILALILCLGLLPTTALAAGTKTLEVGKTLTLRAHGSYNAYTERYGWEIKDESIVSGRIEGGHAETLVLTGLRAGTTTVTLHYQELKWEANAPADWFGDYGENVIYDRTDSWTIEVTGTGDSTPTPTTPEKSYGTVGENVSGTLDGIGAFNNGLVPVKRDGLWGYADKDMKLVIPFQYRSASYIWDCGVAEVNLNGKWCAINKKGDVIASGARYDQIGLKTFGSVTNSGEYIDFFDAKGNKTTYEVAQNDLNDWYAWQHDSGCLAFDCVERGWWQFGTIYDLEDHVLSF